MGKMQGKELCQHWNAVWAERSDHSAYMTVKKHGKEKGEELIPNQKGMREYHSNVSRNSVDSKKEQAIHSISLNLKDIHLG